MKIFLSGIEHGNGDVVRHKLIQEHKKIDYLLMSYFYSRKSSNKLNEIKQVGKQILVDSGAHSFQKGAKVEWLEYTKEYAEWIKKNDCPQILGYFEMDVDNVIGYDKVLQLRKILENATNKIIPVWHKNRGINEYKKMVQQYPFAAITGFKNEDIKDEQYLMFLKYARKHKCKIHCLGMTRTKVLKSIPFYSVDSASWSSSAVFGEKVFFNNKGNFTKEKQPKGTHYSNIVYSNFCEHCKAQKYYYDKWKNI